MYKGNRMDNSIDPERIDEIVKGSIPFPFLMSDNGTDNPENVSQVVYVDELGPETPLMLPSSITIVKEGADGWVTTGYYELVESVKENPDVFPEKYN